MSELRLRADGLHWREVDGEVIALESRESLYLSTNASGLFLWRALAQGTTRDALVAELASRYDVALERARADVDSFLAELAGHGLLEP